MKTIKDLPKGTNLRGIKIKTPNGVVGYWYSQWHKGVWLTKSITDSRMYPQFVNELKECSNWEITEDKVNCHIRTEYEAINNIKKDTNNAKTNNTLKKS